MKKAVLDARLTASTFEVLHEENQFPFFVWLSDGLSQLLCQEKDLQISVLLSTVSIYS